MATDRTIDLRFDYVNTPRRLAGLEEFLVRHIGDYDPVAHERWASDVCIPAIDRDERRAVVWEQSKCTVGNVVLKVSGVGMVEIKNLRTVKEGLGLGAAMLKLTERTVAPELLGDKNLLPSDGIVTINLDTPTGGSAESFFERYGFSSIGYAELYKPGKSETLMQKVVQLD